MNAQPQARLDLSAFAGTPIAVLGLGKSGLAAARALHAGGADVRAWDDDPARRAAAQDDGVALVDLAEADRHLLIGNTRPSLEFVRLELYGDRQVWRPPGLKQRLERQQVPVVVVMIAFLVFGSLTQTPANHGQDGRFECPASLG